LAKTLCFAEFQDYFDEIHSGAVMLPKQFMRKAAKNYSSESNFIERYFFHTTPICQFHFEQEEYQNTKLFQREVDCIYHLLHKKIAIKTAELLHDQCCQYN
jgi:hypothetical protein